MKTIKKVYLILIAIITITTTQSCGAPEAPKDEKLSSFMLGGIYFINGYGGIEDVNEMMSSANYTTNDELISGYKEIFEFPFEPSQSSDIKPVLRSMWEITDKASLLSSIEELKTREYKYKAWDYARIVNNACMGYASGFITSEEGIKLAAEILPLAREKYTNWQEYYTDFNKGRVEWNADDPQKESFEFLAKNITTYENSIYSILPLN